jgi:hypothetical protein
MTETPLRWRKSSFSGQQSDCVEMAARPDGQVLVRNSNRPAAGTLAFSPAELAPWLAACRAGALDDLT